MPFDRISRNMLHNKQNRVRISKGKPKIGDLQEGVPVIREIYTDDPAANAPVAEYLAMYVKHKGKLYENVLTKIDDKRSTSAASIAGSQEKTITSDLLPEKDLEISLGSTVKRFKDVHLGAETIYIGDLSISQVGVGAAAKLQVNSGSSDNNDATEVLAHNISPGLTTTTLGTTSGILTIEQTGADTEDDDNINIKVPDTKKVEFFVDGSAVGSVDSAGFKNAAGSGLLPLAGGTMSGNIDMDGSDLQNLNSLSIDGSGSFDAILDEDDMASNNNTGVATQQSIKAYVDSSSIIGYTHIYNNSIVANSGRIEVAGATPALLTTAVGGTNLSVNFTAPPSTNVEVSLTCLVSSTNDYLRLGLSESNSSYTSVTTEGDYNEFVHYADESDMLMMTVKWVLTGLSSGKTYYVWGSTNGSLNKCYIYHGKNFHHSSTYYNPPIIIKATTLPSVITTGN